MDVKSILAEVGMRPAKRLGQHFLIDNAVALRMVEYAAVAHYERVLEIGAGVGSLTEVLEQKAKRVYAVEIDRRLCALLRERYATITSKTEVIGGDFLKIDLPEFDKVVASIPFSLSSPITYKLLLHERGFGLAVLLYQEEFAKKLVAQPQSPLYGRLSVIAQALAHIELLEVVYRDSFYPPPPVKTAIVRLSERKLLPVDKNRFFWFVTTAFDQRRKKIGSIFKARCPGCLSATEAEKRPEELSPDEFVKIGRDCFDRFDEAFAVE